MVDHRLILKKFQGATSFNQDEWLKPYIEMNTKLRQTAKKWIWKRLF